MKFTWFFLYLLASVFALNAQTLNKSDIQSLPGEAYRVYVKTGSNDANPGNGGTGMVWDFSLLNMNSSTAWDFRVMDSAQMPNNIPGANYCVSERLLTDTDQVAYEYYRDTADGYYLLYDKGEPLTVSYAQPEFLFRFPLGFGDSTQSAFRFSTSAFGVTQYYRGNSVLRYDGTGSLKLPGGDSLGGVVRLKVQSMTLRIGTMDTSYLDIYYWFRPGTHHPILEHREFFDPGGLVFKTTRLYEDAHSSFTKSPFPNAVRLYPNPASDRLYIQSEAAPEECVLYTADGRFTLVPVMSHGKNCSLDLSQIPAGMYFLHMRHSRGISVQKVMVVK